MTAWRRLTNGGNRRIVSCPRMGLCIPVQNRGQAIPCVRCGCAESKNGWYWKTAAMSAGSVRFGEEPVQLIDHLKPGLSAGNAPCIRVTPMLAGERSDRDYKATGLSLLHAGMGRRKVEEGGGEQLAMKKQSKKQLWHRVEAPAAWRQKSARRLSANISAPERKRAVWRIQGITSRPG